MSCLFIFGRPNFTMMLHLFGLSPLDLDLPTVPHRFTNAPLPRPRGKRLEKPIKDASSKSCLSRAAAKAVVEGRLKEDLNGSPSPSHHQRSLKGYGQSVTRT